MNYDLFIKIEYYDWNKKSYDFSLYIDRICIKILNLWSYYIMTYFFLFYM